MRSAGCHHGHGQKWRRIVVCVQWCVSWLSRETSASVVDKRLSLRTTTRDQASTPTMHYADVAHADVDYADDGFDFIPATVNYADDALRRPSPIYSSISHVNMKSST